MMYNKEWAKAAIIRAWKTFFQTFASYITIGSLVSQINWKHALSLSVVSFIYSVATSLAGLPEAKGKENDE